MSSKRPPNDLTRDEWEGFRKAADYLDLFLGDLFAGRKTLDRANYIGCMSAMETIQSTVNIVIGPTGEP